MRILFCYSRGICLHIWILRNASYVKGGLLDLRIIGILLAGILFWFAGFLSCFLTLMRHYKVGIIDANKNVFIPNPNIVKLIDRKVRVAFLEIDYKD